MPFRYCSVSAIAILSNSAWGVSRSAIFPFGSLPVMIDEGDEEAYLSPVAHETFHSSSAAFICSHVHGFAVTDRFSTAKDSLD